MRGMPVSLCLSLIFQLSETVRSIFQDLPVSLSAPSGGILSEGDKRDSEGRAICQETSPFVALFLSRQPVKEGERETQQRWGTRQRP